MLDAPAIQSLPERLYQSRCFRPTCSTSCRRITNVSSISCSSNWTRRKWRPSTTGQRAYAPRQIVSIDLRLQSRRQLPAVAALPGGSGVHVLAGRNCPNFRVLSDFRKDAGNSSGPSNRQLALALGLVSLGRQSVQVQGERSKHKAMSYDGEGEGAGIVRGDRSLDPAGTAATRKRIGSSRTVELPDDLATRSSLKKVREMKQALEAREQELRPGREIEDKKQISFADPEARIMKQKGDFEYAYNAQISVDGKSQVIVGQHVSQQANDAQEVAPALDEVEETSGRLPEKLSLDNGYYSGKNLQETSDRKVEAYIATDRGEKRGKGDLDASKRYLVKADFRYDEERDGFHCPGGQLLRLKTTRGTGQRVYQGDIDECRSCAYYRRCCRSKSGAARTITSDGKEPLRRAMNERMSQPESQAIYARRKTIVEPVFGQIKNSGFRGFGLRGKAKVAGEFSLVCAAHNLKKIIFAALRGEVCPEFGKRAAWA